MKMIYSKAIHHFTRSILLPNSRSFKNFGHRRQPEAAVTVLWHGFLTFTFIGICAKWDWVAKIMLGENRKNLPTLFEQAGTDPVYSE